MLIRDRETGSIWQQATGEALAGPLKGHQLALLSSEQTRWAGWRQDHPDSFVAVESPGHAGSWKAWLQQKVVARVLRYATSRVRGPGLLPNDNRLPSHEEVAGIRVAGEARAYPLSTLRSSSLLNDSLGGVPVAIVYDSAADRVRAFHRRWGKTCATLVLDGRFLINEERSMKWDLKGRAIEGTEKNLERIDVAREWWLGWSEFHPGTGVYPFRTGGAG